MRGRWRGDVRRAGRPPAPSENGCDAVGDAQLAEAQERAHGSGARREHDPRTANRRLLRDELAGRKTAKHLLVEREDLAGGGTEQRGDLDAGAGAFDDELRRTGPVFAIEGHAVGRFVQRAHRQRQPGRGVAQPVRCLVQASRRADRPAVDMARAGRELLESRADQLGRGADGAIGARERASPVPPPRAPRAAAVPASAVGAFRRPSMVLPRHVRVRHMDRPEFVTKLKTSIAGCGAPVEGRRSRRDGSGPPELRFWTAGASGPLASRRLAVRRLGALGGRVLGVCGAGRPRPACATRLAGLPRIR